MTKKINWKDEEVLNIVFEGASKGLSSTEIAAIISKKFGVNANDRAVRRVAGENNIDLLQTNNNGYTDNIKVEEERRADGSLDRVKRIEMTEEEAMDDDFVLRAHGFDPEKWDIINIRNGYWEQGSRAEGTKRLYSSRITVKPKVDKITPAKIAEIMSNTITPKEFNTEITVDSNDSLVIPLFDIHFGIETYGSLETKLSQIVKRIRQGYKNVAIVVGGDFLHSNEINKTVTVNGTILDDVDNVQSLEDASKFMSMLIENALLNAENVSVTSIGGNHDFSKQYMFIWGLKMKYPNVNIDLTDATRTAFNLGEIGIMVAHGDVATKRLPMLFATEFIDVWSKSKYRTVFTGHYHTEKVTDVEGVVLHQFGTPKKSDPYEKRNGFTMARKHIQLLEFSESRLLATYEIE